MQQLSLLLCIPLGLALGAFTWGQEIAPPGPEYVPFAFPRQPTHVGHLAFSPDGKLLAGASAEFGSLAVWEVASGKAVAHFRGGDDPGLYGDRPALSPDGKTMIGPSYRWVDPRDKDHVRSGALQRFDLAAEECLPPWLGHRSPVAVAAFSPDGKLLASGGMAWTGGGLFRFNRGVVREGKFDTEVNFRPEVILWDTAIGRPRFTLRGPSFPVKDKGNFGCPWILRFSPDGRRLAVGSLDDVRVNVWDTATGKLVRSFLPHLQVADLRFDSPGECLFAGFDTGEVRRWNLATGAEKVLLKGRFGYSDKYPVLLGPDARFMIVRILKPDRLVLWDLTEGRQCDQFRPELPEQAEIHDNALSPDGKTVAVGIDKGVVLLELPTGKRITTLAVPKPRQFEPR